MIYPVARLLSNSGWSDREKKTQILSPRRICTVATETANGRVVHPRKPSFFHADQVESPLRNTRSCLRALHVPFYLPQFVCNRFTWSYIRARVRSDGSYERSMAPNVSTPLYCASILQRRHYEHVDDLKIVACPCCLLKKWIREREYCVTKFTDVYTFCFYLKPKLAKLCVAKAVCE